MKKIMGIATETDKKLDFKSTFDYKVIYAFRVDDDAHRGLIKIGDATLHTDTPIDSLAPGSSELNQAAFARIKSYTNTVAVKPLLLHTELAVKNVKGRLQAFRDHDVHAVLENSGIKKVKINGSTGREWYRIDKETVLEAIDAVKKDYLNLSHATSSEHIPVIFRPEQKAAIDLTVKQFQKSDRMLWNAKMRFGKTLSALEVVKQCNYKKTIILTHRPVVNAGWYEDFNKIFYGEKCIYGSKVNGYTVEKLLDMDKNFVYFASIQDLRGSALVGGKFGKNDAVFNTVWDCVIIDEAHEGTKTSLGDETIKAIVKEDLHKTKVLSLSGTPFNIMDEYDDNSIYTWDYIMEQECKSEWDKQHFGDSNPYDELPDLRIYVYDLGDILNSTNYITYEDKAFNFHEFFRTWTGDYKYDYAQMPKGAEEGDFVHEQDVLSFLNLMTKKDGNNGYPYSKDEYRDLFKHSLWMLPGVREAKALKKLMSAHPVFGNGQFNIVNVAGNNDEESSDALSSVKKAISKAEKTDTYTITLSCGKLTTGVTVKEWTGVFMLAGSFSTSASNYLQTIFRVQSPCNKDGKIKRTAYVFDFAPDRTLKMVSEAVSVSSKAGKSKNSDKYILGKFLNYCPVIAINGSKMKEYKADKLLQQLKKAYADKVVRNGFDDAKLYNDELLKLQDDDLIMFEDLKSIIGKSKAAPKQNEINVNEQGLTNEEYEKMEKLSKKPTRELSEVEKAELEELKKKRKIRNDAISVLRGISIRMPLLIYGADVPYDEEITIDRFVEKVDDSSWKEFMPTDVTKELFSKFRKYYDEDVFIAAGRRIRNIAREADTMNPFDRTKKIAGLFAYFKNPDKETVLTPWRVVNMHMSDTLGGFNFYDEKNEEVVDEPRFVDQGKVTMDVFGNENARVLELNSKTGLYPLYIAYSIYRAKCSKIDANNLTLDVQRKVWKDTVRENVFVICKTPMAKQITQRTLVGYSKTKINAHYFDDLINAMKNKPQQFIERVQKPSYWKKGGEKKMKFDAIVGNPPYMEIDGGNGVSAKPVYNLFVTQAKMLNPDYLSMIMPARWYVGGKGLDTFRSEMLNDNRICKLVDFPSCNDVFPTVDIAGGVCYFLRNITAVHDCEIVNSVNGNRDISHRKLNEFDVFIRENLSVDIVHKILSQNNEFLNGRISPRKPFGLPSNYQSADSGVPCWFIQKIGLGYANVKDIDDPRGYLNKWKILIPAAPIAGQTDFTKPVAFFYNGNTKVAKPGECCTETWLVAGAFDTEEEAVSFKSYLLTKVTRFLLLQAVASQHISIRSFSFIPELKKYKGVYTDKMLCEKWNITNKEWQYIDSRIRN